MVNDIQCPHCGKSFNDEDLIHVDDIPEELASNADSYNDLD